MRVLVDTSVWIEYFRSRSPYSDALLGFIDLLIADYRLATIYPIQVELLSGKLASTDTQDIQAAFESMPHIDLDWNDAVTWQGIIKLAHVAHRNKIPPPGIVDRMILAAARENDAQLWTFDRKLKRLAEKVDVSLF